MKRAYRLVLTGATSPIGVASARALAAQGWQLILHTFHQSEGAKTLAAEIAPDGGCQIWQQDLADHDQVASDLRRFQKESALPPIGGLVCNAAVNLNGLTVNSDVNKIRPLVDVNLLAVYNCTQVALRSMLQQHFGRIVLIGSTAGLTGNAGQAAYTMTKAALPGLAKSLAREYGARGITANVVAPGWIETPMSMGVLATRQAEILATIPAGYIGSPDDVAAAVAFLASDKARYINGQTLPVNGGLYMN